LRSAVRIWRSRMPFARGISPSDLAGWRELGTARGIRLVWSVRAVLSVAGTPLSASEPLRRRRHQHEVPVLAPRRCLAEPLHTSG